MKKIIALGNFPENLTVPGVEIVHYPQTYLSTIGNMAQQLEWLRRQQADGYVGTNDIAALKATIASNAQEQIDAMLVTQNKYLARQAISDATNYQGFIELAHASQQSAGFIKPVRSSLSFAAAQFQTNDEIRYHISHFKAPVADRNTTFKELVISAGADTEYVKQVDEFIVETAITYPEQCTVDGFVQNGKITIIGATKSILHENNFSFVRFDFPMRESGDMLAELYAQTTQAISALKLNNTTFNCELRFDPTSGKAAIIEVNARMSMQFRPLFLAVTGWDMAAVAVQIAAGIPAHKTQKASVGDASIHILRHHSDDYILAAPDDNKIRRIEAKYPGSKVASFVRENTYLSDTPQDGLTYRYAQIFMPEKGTSARSALRLLRMKKDLDFTFESNAAAVQYHDPQRSGSTRPQTSLAGS